MRMNVSTQKIKKGTLALYKRSIPALNAGFQLRHNAAGLGRSIFIFRLASIINELLSYTNSPYKQKWKLITTDGSREREREIERERERERERENESWRVAERECGREKERVKRGGGGEERQCKT